MAFDFPANPVNGQTYLGYTYNGLNWILTAGTGTPSFNFSGEEAVTDWDGDDLFLLNVTEDAGITFTPKSILASNVFAPSNSNFYVQQNLEWVDLGTALTEVGFLSDIIDGGDFGLTLALGSDDDVFDGGDFSTTTASGTTSEALDGGIFAGTASDLLLDGGVATL